MNVAAESTWLRCQTLFSSVKVFLFVKLLIFWGRRRLQLFNKLQISEAR